MRVPCFPDSSNASSKEHSARLTLITTRVSVEQVRAMKTVTPMSERPAQLQRVALGVSCAFLTYVGLPPPFPFVPGVHW